MTIPNFISQFFAVQSNRELAKYVVSAGVITLLSFIYFYGFNLFFDYPIAYGLTFIIGVCTQFAAQSLFVFRVPMKMARLPIMFLIYIFQAIITFLFLFLLIEKLGIDELISYICATFLAFPLTFLLNRKLLKR